MNFNLIEFILENEKVWTALGIVAGLLVAWKPILSKLCIFTKKVIFGINTLLDLPEKFQAIVLNQERIAKELTCNGGSSLKDQVSRIEKCLNQSIAINKAKFKAIFTHLTHSVGLYEKDTKGNCTFVNHAWIELTGVTHEEAMGNGWFRAIVPEEREKIFEAIKYAIENNAPMEFIYHVFNSKTGETIKVIDRSFAITNNNGEILEYYGVIERYHQKDGFNANEAGISSF